MKYRKKPVVIDAIQVVFGKTDVSKVISFVGSENLKSIHPDTPRVVTRYGETLILDGDYIIKENGVLSVMDEVSFLKLFESVKKPARDMGEFDNSGLVQVVMKHYGFTAVEAQRLLSNDVSRKILFDNLDTVLANDERQDKYSIDFTYAELDVLNYGLARFYLEDGKTLVDTSFDNFSSAQDKISRILDY